MTRKSDGGRRRKRPERRGRPGSSFLFLGALAVVTLAAAMRHLWATPWILGYLAAVNLVSFGLYGWDKGMSKLGFLRVPERVLHVFDIAGGTPGGFAAQQLFRHKTVKTSFRRVFWIVAAVQAAAAAGAAWYLLLKP